MDDAELDALCEGLFAFVCERRVGEFVDGAELMAGLDAAATEPRLARLIARFVAPSRARLLDRARAGDVKLGAWLPAPVHEALAALLGRPAPIPRALIDELVASDEVRDSVRVLLHETFTGVVSKGFAPAGRGIRGMFSVLGDELQRQLSARVRDFVDGGVQILQKRVAQKLASDETARQLGRRRRRAFLDGAARPESFVVGLLDRVAWAVSDAAAPSVIAHNLARAELRAALEAEIAAALAELSTQTIGELLDELGLRELVHTAVRTRGPSLAREFLASPHFSR